MLHSFTDDGDGLYQVEVAEGDPLPDWTQRLTAITADQARALIAPPANQRPVADAEFKAKREIVVGRLVQLAVVADFKGDTAFRDALLACRVAMIPLDSHPLVKAAPDTDLTALRNAYKAAYAAVAGAALATAPDDATRASWTVEIAKVFN